MQYFGTLPDGRIVNRYTLTNGNGVTLSAINYGGIITSICVPDRNGKIEDVVLGYDTLDGYLNDTHYMGAIVGRCANRIYGAEFELDNKIYKLYKNEGNNSHHGGQYGFNTKWWNIQKTTSEEGEALVLTYTSPDGEEGYPGTVNVEVLYILTENDEIIIRYTAQTDKKTIINLTNHSYFNLSGSKNDTVQNHTLQILSSEFLPLNKYLVPTGEFRFVGNTSLDFREEKTINSGLNFDDEQIVQALGIDHSFLSTENSEYAVRYSDKENGRVLKIKTTEPCVHVYSGNFLNDKQKGKNGISYQKYSAIAFEAQHYPDSIHHSNFPSVVFNQQDRYKAETRFVFSVD